MIQKKKLLGLLASLVVIVIAFLPHSQNGMFLGSDDYFHYHRIISVADAIKNGIFPVKLHFIAAYGYGYGEGFFYSNALLYIPAVLISFFGLSLLVAYKIFVFLLYDVGVKSPSIAP